MKKGFNFIFDPIDNLEEKWKNLYKWWKEVRAKTWITKRNFLKWGKYLDIFRNTKDKKIEALLKSKDNRDKAFLEYLLENKSFENFKPAPKFIPQLYIINPKATHDLLSLHSRWEECYSMADYIEIFRKSNDFSENLSSLRIFCIKLAINSSKDWKKAGYLEFLKIIL